jgi:hypothetical protein
MPLTERDIWAAAQVYVNRYGAWQARPSQAAMNASDLAA